MSTATQRSYETSVSFGELHKCSYDQFLDLLAVLVGEPQLYGITYQATAVNPDGTLRLQVQGMLPEGDSDA